MSHDAARASLALGFLTVVAHPQLGLIGGLLVLNQLGRPLEFHCTAPVKANRAQQILYGATLLPYLYGEQIGQTLLSKVTAKPAIVLVDVEAALAAREHVELPVALVERGAVGDGAAARVQLALRESGVPLAASQPAPAGSAAGQLSWSSYALTLSKRHSRDADAVRASLSALAESFDLLEPFDRIREAIDEAGRGKQAA